MLQLVIIAAGAVIGMLLQQLRIASLENELRSTQSARDVQFAQNKDLSRQLNEAWGNTADQRRRYDEMVLNLKAEISTLRSDLDACTDPDVVFDRLQRVLRGAAKTNPDNPVLPGPPAANGKTG